MNKKILSITILLMAIVASSSLSFANVNSAKDLAAQELNLKLGETSSEMIAGELFPDLGEGYQIYSNKRSGDVEVVGAIDDEGNEIPELKNQILNIPSGSILEIVDRSEDGEFLSFSFDLEEMLKRGEDTSELPNIIKVRAKDFAQLDLELINLGKIDSAEGMDEDTILPDVVAGKYARKGSMTYCLKDVRIYASSHCHATVVRIERASKARAAYLATGKWKTISRSSWADYPVCTACFYSGGRQDCSNGSDCGHAAIKIASGNWKGAGVRSIPSLPNKNGVFNGVRRKPYHFQGCIIPK